MGIGWGRTTLSKPVFTNPHLCFSATEPPHAMPAPRLSQAPRSLWRKLLIHHRPSPIRRTASHSAVVSQVEVTAELLASRVARIRNGYDRCAHQPAPEHRAAALGERGQPLVAVLGPGHQLLGHRLVPQGLSLIHI